MVTAFDDMAGLGRQCLRSTCTQGIESRNPPSSQGVASGVIMTEPRAPQGRQKQATQNVGTPESTTGSAGAARPAPVALSSSPVYRPFCCPAPGACPVSQARRATLSNYSSSGSELLLALRQSSCFYVSENSAHHSEHFPEVWSVAVLCRNVDSVIGN